MIRYNVKDITMPKAGLVVYKDSYWLCEDGNPEKALFYGDSPQCNRDRRISEWVLEKSYKNAPNIQIVFIETAFVPNRD